MAMNTSHLIAVASLALLTGAMPAAAQTAGPAINADAAMNHHLLQEYKNLGPRTWVNPMMPAATGNDGAPALSADLRLQRQVASYTREMLDRGGWRNAWAAGDHYAAGEPLLAAAVGAGVTSTGAAEPMVPRHLAAF
jgi:hypothetical protein